MQEKQDFFQAVSVERSPAFDLLCIIKCFFSDILLRSAIYFHCHENAVYCHCAAMRYDINPVMSVRTCCPTGHIAPKAYRAPEGASTVPRMWHGAAALGKGHSAAMPPLFCEAEWGRGTVYGGRGPARPGVAHGWGGPPQVVEGARKSGTDLYRWGR